MSIASALVPRTKEICTKKKVVNGDVTEHKEEVKRRDETSDATTSSE